MNVKKAWKEENFEEMGWHDSYIYVLFLPNDDLVFKLDIESIIHK